MHFLSDLKISQLLLEYSSISLIATSNAFGRMPNKNGALSSNTHDESLVWRDLDLYIRLVFNKFKL